MTLNTESVSVAETSRQAEVREPGPLQGAVLVLIQFDVCEEIKLDQLRQIFGARKQAQPSFKHPAPWYVRYERPPVVEPIEALVLESGEKLQGQIKYYDYGVLSVVLELPFAGDWDTLVRLGSRWVWDVDFAGHASRIVRQRLERAAPALVKPYTEWLSEDYFIFHLREVAGAPSASDLVASQGARIAQIVRGEKDQLSDGERNEILQSRISYYPNDLAVIGYNAAFVYDTPAGAETAIQLLEYANSQLLEFRHYDELLTRELAGVYAGLKPAAAGAGIVRRWKMRSEAMRLNGVTVEVTELVERSDTAIKFVSDMFSARLYRLAAAKVGVPEYKNLVNEKLRTAENLYRFLIDEFHQSRGFVLEVMVVIILVIELIYLFKGKG